METPNPVAQSVTDGVIQPYQTWMVAMLAIVIAIGVPGNLLVGAVYLSKPSKNSTHVFILVMAILDLEISVFSVVRIIHWLHESTYKTEYKCQLYRILSLWSEFYSAYMTTAIAVDRYFQICRPHYHMTVRKAIVGSFIGLAVSNLSSFMIAFLYGIEDSTCQIVKEGIALYLPLGLAFSTFIILMVTALVLYLLVFLEVRKRFHTRNNFGSVIFVQPATDNDAADSVGTSGRQIDTETRFEELGVNSMSKVKNRRTSDTGGPPSEEAKADDGTSSKSTQSVSTSIKTSATYLGVRIKRSPDGSEEVEVERAVVSSIEEKAKSVVSATEDVNHRREFSNSVASSSTAVDQQYKTLMTAILQPTNDMNMASKQMADAAAVSLNRQSSTISLIHRDSLAIGDRRQSFAGLERRRSSMIWQHRGSRASPSIGRTARMLLLATLVFVGTWTARCIMWLITNIGNDWWERLRLEHTYAFAFLTLVQHIYYTTPAVNPIIYSFANPRFRGDSLVLLRTVRGWRQRVFPL